MGTGGGREREVAGGLDENVHFKDRRGRLRHVQPLHRRRRLRPGQARDREGGGAVAVDVAAAGRDVARGEPAPHLLHCRPALHVPGFGGWASDFGSRA